MAWLLSVPRGDSDERGLAGEVGEAGEVGGLGVAHCTGNRNEQGGEWGVGGGREQAGLAPEGREQGRRQAERTAEPGDLPKLRQNGLLWGAGAEHMAPGQTWPNPGSAGTQCGCGWGQAWPPGPRLPSHQRRLRGSWHKPPQCAQGMGWRLSRGIALC